jgi:hypothetical protein
MYFLVVEGGGVEGGGGSGLIERQSIINFFLQKEERAYLKCGE